MVKKLYKHEFLAWLRVMPIFFVLPLIAAGFHRILQLFETDSVVYDIISISALLLFFLTLLVCLSAPTVYGVVRFYKNLFTGEGYLTFTLPVKTTTHLWVKVLTNMVFHIAAFVVCLLSGLLITAGEVLAETWEAGMFLWKMIPAEDCAHLAGYFAEFLVLLLVTVFCTIMQYNSCLCIGQLAKKNRILLSVGVYFGYYMITQVCSTVFIILFTVLDMAGALDVFYNFFDAHPYAAGHLSMCGSIVLYAVLALVFWLVCRFILRKKLNLE